MVYFLLYRTYVKQNFSKVNSHKIKKYCDYLYAHKIKSMTGMELLYWMIVTLDEVMYDDDDDITLFCILIIFFRGDNNQFSLIGLLLFLRR